MIGGLDEILVDFSILVLAPVSHDIQILYDILILRARVSFVLIIVIRTWLVAKSLLEVGAEQLTFRDEVELGQQLF